MILAALMALGCVQAVSATPSPTETARTGPAQPNVMIVLADDLSERDIDRIETPHFDAMAAKGLRFRRAYANPTCSPSRWSLHFGQYHTQDAGPVCKGIGNPPALDQLSLPKVFGAAGYRTGLFGKWHLGSHPGVEKGEPWEETPRLHGYHTWRAGMPVNTGSCGGRSVNEWLRVDDGHAQMSKAYVNDAIRDAFLEWHAAHEAAEGPWFALMSFQAPHAPRHFPPGTPPRERKPSAQSRYTSQVRSLDRDLATLLDAVDLERTLVIFVGDNGAPMGSPGYLQEPGKCKRTTFEGGIRVPMVAMGPGVPAGVETQSLVHLADFLPTFAELVASELDPANPVAPVGSDTRRSELGGLDGASFLPVFDATDAVVRDYVWTGVGSGPQGEFAVVTTSHKLRRDGRGELHLFDLDADPFEEHNLAASEEHAALLAALAQVLERHVLERFPDRAEDVDEDEASR